ncbi:hypothetical protein [Rhodococcus qingshengii]|uniref:hypothetical protein n=1 Tax=Rhodococcus qingshengii TaxID=334542 RepID=UPI001F3D1CDF|nr:hypothetical protein [Rhodococcus qingshengii]
MSLETCTLNIEFAEEVYQYLIDHPDEHNQGQWTKTTPCGTVRCIAGTACHLAGYEITAAFGVTGALAYTARKLLGLTAWEADRLFFLTDNTAALHLFREYIDRAEDERDAALVQL